MGKISRVPYFEPVIPACMSESLLIKDSLSEQREEARHLLHQAQDFYRRVWESGSHDLINPDTAKWGLRRTDQTTLQQNRSEDRGWMERISWSAQQPIAMRSVCSYFDKLGPVKDAIADTPWVRLAVVTGFPHGSRSPKEAYEEIKRFALATEGIPNTREVDPVTAYGAWMRGDFKLVADILKAEQEAVQEFGLSGSKPILNINVDSHSSTNSHYGRDYFRSVYERTWMICEHGGNPKTSTGQAAEPPWNDHVPKDAGHIIAALPMYIATRDYNRENATSLFNKTSGGVESEVDIAMLRSTFNALYDNKPELVDAMAIGANYRLRKRVVNYLISENDPEIGPEFGMPEDYDARDIPQHLIGLPDPNPSQLKSPRNEGRRPAPDSPDLPGGPTL